ncbi:hypothetical protein Y032_0350g3216 [Ancylostoma ceylanicum]|uniref:Uncharacterized protein n=1 Tax=Ancylostoma ceylanicum TaxID=53326 RepID=A0A016RWP1_9BILA|nr:hypothetical protein Y032_0350g3216 [Ancylostoma ceylanicum]
MKRTRERVQHLERNERKAGCPHKYSTTVAYETDYTYTVEHCSKNAILTFEKFQNSCESDSSFEPPTAVGVHTSVSGREETRQQMRFARVLPSGCEAASAKEPALDQDDRDYTTFS